MARGLVRGTKNTREKNILFIQLRAVQEWSSCLKCAEPRHHYLGSIIGDPRGACYKSGREKVQNHLLFLLEHPSRTGRGKSVLTSDVVRITHQKGHWMPGLLQTRERNKISLFHGEARRGLQANHQRITNRAYVTKNRLVFRQTSKETVEALIQEGSRQGKDVAGLP
jgi:hypothetical protein